MLREEIQEHGVVVLTSGSNPMTTRVCAMEADGRVGGELAVFVTYGSREGDQRHAATVKDARAGRWSQAPKEDTQPTA